MRGLYAIVDVDISSRVGLGVLDFAAAVIEGKPAAVQLRAKSLSARETLALLRPLASMARRQGVTSFANDRPDLALLAGCDGVHVGQEDLSVADVRRIAPTLRVGISTHSEEQARAALLEGPDYLAFGPIYPTASKRNADPCVGLTSLRNIRTLADVPLVAIGGIDFARAQEVAESAPCFAVISALLPAGNASDPLAEITERTRRLHRIACGGGCPADR